MFNQLRKICALSPIFFVFILYVHANGDRLWWKKCVHDLPKDLACKSAEGCCGDTRSDTCPPPMGWDNAWMCGGPDWRQCCRPSKCHQCDPPIPNNLLCRGLHACLKFVGICPTNCNHVYVQSFWFPFSAFCTALAFPQFLANIIKKCRGKGIQDKKTGRQNGNDTTVNVRSNSALEQDKNTDTSRLLKPGGQNKSNSISGQAEKTETCKSHELEKGEDNTVASPQADCGSV